MSTDDSISEDVSSSGALSHCHVDANGDGGKESEASLVSSEGTSASGLAGPEEGLTCSSKTAGGPAESRPTDITKACNIPQKIRSLCLSTEEAFGPGRSLPFINPSSLETLRALVQEIQSSGETDPEIWKDCEGRWLHLFQLVEKQYQEQILAQQEQYQCQIQLIQDEIKALVQLQNRQGAQPHPEYTSTPAITTKGYPLHHNDPPTPTDLPNGNGRLSAPPPLISMSPSPQPPGHRTTRTGESTEERAATVLSSGYGTLSPWDTGMEQTRTPGGTEEPGQGGEETHLSPPLQDHTETTLIGHQQSLPNEMPPRAEAANPSLQAKQQRTSTQPLTSWAQRQKRRPKKSKAGQTSPQASELQEQQQQQPSPRNSLRDGSLEHTDLQDQHRSSVPSSNSFPLRRSDSLVSEASGLTYWRLDESELYRPLPDSFDSGAYLLLQETSMSLTPQEEPRISLREIYQNKQRTDSKRTDWDGSLTSSPMSPQVLTLDPTVHVRQSDRTSGFTSPSYFSSPSFPTQPLPYPCVGTPVSPDSMVEGSANPGDTDCTSNASSLSATTPTPAKVHSSQASPSLGVPSTSQARTQPYFLSNSQQHRASAPLASEEEGSHTHTSTLKPQSHTREMHTPSGVSPLRAGSPRMERAASLEDPVVLSLLRQNLREKHAKHVADLKAYYESEIRALRDKLNLRDLPQDLEKSNQALRERCDHLERALTEASSRIQELETKNCILEKKLVDWPERYAVAGAMVTALQQRLEESKRSGKEKDASAARLRTRVHQLEEALQNACRESDEREDRREREYKMLQDLLGEYDSLRKDHEGVKDNLNSTENKLFDANEQISELRRVVSKLESQVKQLEHENQARARYAPHSHTQPSGAGLLHHPDLLHSPSKHPREPENTYRRSPCPQTDQLNSHRKSPCPKTDQSAGSSGSMDNSRRCQSPPEREQPQEQCGGQREPGRREGPLTPVMKALIELEETRATEGQAPCKNSSASDRRGSRRPTVGFMEWGHREPVEDRGRAVEDRGGTAPEREGIGPERGGTTPERGWTAPQRGWTALQRGGTAPERGGTAPERGGTAPERGGTAPERGAALLRAQRSLSPEGHRSSSLPPRAQRTFPPVTPTKRETLIMPLSARSSPKRCPTENYSTAFDNTITQQHPHNRFDVPLDQRCHSFNSTSPRKRLHFTALDRQEGSQQSCIGFADFSGSVDPAESGPRLGWEEHGVGGCRPDLQDPGEDSGLSLQTRLHSLVDAERLFDELTQEKQQIEASLSRMPGAGGRVSLQARLDEVALEKRLERVNRDLGSIRMTLKRFHVLRSSANI